MSMTAPAPSWLQNRPRYRADIEGLRAVAVVIVVLFHAKVPGFEGGFIGVDVFFVLSGYLITWLLVDEAEQKGGINLARFYARRARRLLPAMAVVLVFTLAGTALLYAPFEQRMMARTWAATALYVSNIDFASRTLDYHGASAETNPLLHTWSLSVEEQFYLIWPCLVLLGLGVAAWQRRRRSPSVKRLSAVLGVTTGLSFALSLYLTSREGSWAFYLSPTRAWEFGIGGLAVLVPIRTWGIPARYATMVAKSGSVLAVAGLGLATVFFGSETPFPGVAALVPVLATVVLLRAGAVGAGTEDGFIPRVLSARPMQWIGKLSYSWYLWHWPILVFAAAIAEPLGALERFSALAISFGLAVASYTWVENPLRHHKMLAVRPSRSFIMAAAVSLFATALTGVWWKASISWSESESQVSITRISGERPRLYQDDCDRFGESVLLECVYGDSTAARTAVLIGDSHAGQWFPAIEPAAMSAGWRLVVLTRSSCPMVDLPPLYNPRLSRLYSECPEWRQAAIERLGEIQPELTLVGSATGYEVPIADWQVGTKALMEQLVQPSGRTVLLVDTPLTGIDIPSCLARAAWRLGNALDPDCRPPGVPEALRRADVQVDAVRSVAGIEVLDLRDDVCVIGECEAMSGEIVRYRDIGHVSVEFASTFEDQFYDLLTESEDSEGGSSSGYPSSWRLRRPRSPGTPARAPARRAG
ncbi:MAG: acyltransferase family protein [Rubricoccaceae bacterium]